MKNLAFFKNIVGEKTVRSAARHAGITPQHGTRLAKLWREAGWIVRSAKGSSHTYTEEGALLRAKIPW